MKTGSFNTAVSLTPWNILGTVILGVVIYIVYQGIKILLHIRHLKKTFRDYPTPGKVHWLAGHMIQELDDGEKRLGQLMDLTRKFPRLFCFWMGPQPAIFLPHPETAKAVLKTAEPKTVGYGGVYRHGLPWLGTGLLIAGGKRWARARRLLTPAFHFDVLHPYMEIYNEAAEELLNNISPCVGESFEAFRIVSACTLDIILRCAFSYRTNCQNLGKSHPYVTAVNEITDIWSQRNRKPWLHPDVIFYLTRKGRQFMKQCKFVHNVAEEVIDKRKKALEAGTVKEKKYKDFLDILLMAKDESGQGLTRKEIRNEVDTFLFEGYDTTASAISWILYSFAMYPEHQVKVQEEIDSVLDGRQSHRIEWSDLPKLEYLTMCIKESMRLHSPVPLIQRQTTKECTIDGYTFPAGTIFNISIYLLHHNPTVWENHDEYRPERFSKSASSKMDSFAFTPFSAGPRNCIGQNFAMNEEKVVVARILHKYTIEVDRKVPVKKRPVAVMRAQNGIHLSIKPRH